MRAMITGASGAVGTGLKQYLIARGDTVIGWNRQQIPLDDYGAMEAFVRAEKPDVLFHLATASTLTGRDNETWLVNYEWTSELAWICRVLDVRFVFTSSVMVFTDFAVGPFTLDSQPDATEGYGYEKRRAEERVLQQNPNAVVARIGWQIGETAGPSQMVGFFETQMQNEGQINASTRWYPACSFISDTAATLVQLANDAAGLYLLDSNTKWTFYEIATALNERHGNRWKIVPNEAFVFDQRMIDDRTAIPSLKTHLPSLP